MVWHINRRLLLLLTLSFVVVIIAGTLLHELGHYTAARLMGFNARISYAFTWLIPSGKYMNPRQLCWFTIAGPLQTMLTGTIGFLLLLRSGLPKMQLAVKHWISIFLSLFWLRQSVNFLFWVGGFFLYGHFTENGDEIKLSQYWRMHPVFITSFTALIGIAVLTFTTFKIISKLQRLSFLLAGLIGGVLGFLLWFVLLGKLILP